MKSKKTGSGKSSKPNPVGRPSEYRPEYCEKLIEFLREGRAFEQFASQCDVSINTTYEWAKKHPEFREAKKRAEALSLNWWLEQGRLSLNKTVFRDTPWIFNMKCRFGKYGFNPDNTLNTFFDDDEENGLEFSYEKVKA